MTAVILLSSERPYQRDASWNSPLSFSLDPASLEVKGVSHALTARLGLPGLSWGETLSLSSLCAVPGDAEALSTLLRSGRGLSPFETVLRGHSGENVPVLLSCARENSVYRCSVLELTSLRSYQEIKQKAGAEAVRWQDFTTTAAHELRTPLQPVLGYLSLLYDNYSSYGISDEVARMLGVCLDNVDRERRVVNRMLELSLLDRGEMKNRPTVVDLAALIREVLQSHDFTLRARCEVSVPEGMTVLVDREQFYLVLEGLVSNAVEYSEDPRVVEISCGQEGRRQWVRVRDNGPGIDPAKLKTIFEPFSLGDSETLSRRYGRMGLGLPIAERYARQNGGWIEVESAPGEGSTFTIMLERWDGGAP